jgi:hypothetical protein
MKRTMAVLLPLALLIGVLAIASTAMAGAKIDVTVVMHNARNEEIVWGIANRIKSDLEQHS